MKQYLFRFHNVLLLLLITLIAIIAYSQLGIAIDIKPLVANVPMGHFLANLVDMFLKSRKNDFLVPNLAGVIEAGIKCYESIIEKQLSTRGEYPMTLKLAKERLALSDLKVAIKFSELHTKESITKLMDIIVKKSQNAEEEVSKAGAKLHATYDGLLLYNANTLTLGLEYGSKILINKEDLKKKYNSLIIKIHEDLESVLIGYSMAGSILNELDEYLRVLLDLFSEEKSLQEIDNKQLLASIWTKLGQHKEEKAQLEKNLALLTNVDSNRKEFAEGSNDVLVTLRVFKYHLEGVLEKIQQNKYSEEEFAHHLERLSEISRKNGPIRRLEGNVKE